MQWIQFSKTPVRLMVANVEDRQRRLAILFPTSPDAPIQPQTAAGQRFKSMGFKYQAKNNAWYRPTTGLSTKQFLVAFRGDAQVVEMRKQSIYLTVSNKHPKGLNNDTQGANDTVATRRTAGSGERGTQPDRSAGLTPASTDQHSLPLRVERASDSGGPVKTIGGSDNGEAGRDDRRADEGIAGEGPQHDETSRVPPYDASTGSGDAAGRDSAETAGSGQPLAKTSEGLQGNYIPAQRGKEQAQLSLNERFDRNITALQLLNTLDAKTDPVISQDEAESLLGFSGWGGLLDHLARPQHQEILINNLGRTGLYDAKESALTAFYTPTDLCAGIWDLLKTKGYQGGRVAETSAGTGVFINQRPNGLDSQQHFSAVEMESISGRILKYTNPAAWVQQSAMERASLPADAFDLVIGNVPFGEFKVSDTEIKDSLSIHNYFLQKSINRCRVGGITAILTSTWTLDAENTHFRERIAEQADLLAAVRLPAGVFGGSHTEAVSDFLVFKKRKAGTPYQGIPFVNTEDQSFPASRSFKIDINQKNEREYFKDDMTPVRMNEAYLGTNGGLVAGEVTAVGNRFGDQYLRH